MRFDVVTIFSEMFDTLDVSLIGKARDAGRIETHVHNLRDWATGKHLSVDAPPAGGGAGMVMRPDVWGDAIDAVLSDVVRTDTVLNDALPDDGDKDSREAGVVVAIPTPAGTPLTQCDVERLALADQIVIPCGRYEGIDSRVAGHYRDEGVEVFEFSLGDYVLNGGEVAALALIEAVGRLVPGVVGNPASLEVESHSPSGLLEAPVYTAPNTWRGRETPSILFSGHHANIARYRRDQSLRKTLRVRPDLIDALADRHREALAALNADKTLDEKEKRRARGSLPLDRGDLEVLAADGVAVLPYEARLDYQVGEEADLPAVSALATELFPYACPAGTTQAEIDAFTSEFLTAPALKGNVEDEGARVLFAVATPPGGEPVMVGYTLMFPDIPDDLERPPEDLCGKGGPCYLSKIYTKPEWHGSGLAGALLQRALEDAQEHWDPGCVVLGTNIANRGATRFYRRNGFVKYASRTFDVGGRQHSDYVFVRDLTAHPAR